jgi:hypothetical protein
MTIYAKPRVSTIKVVKAAFDVGSCLTFNSQEDGIRGSVKLVSLMRW